GAQGGGAIAATVVFLGLASLFAWFAVTQRRSAVIVTTRDVTLNIPIYGRRMALDRLIPDNLGKVTMKEPDRYRLTLRTNGLSVPGYQVGWFRTQAAGRVLAAVSGNDLVVWQTRDDYGVVVSAQDGDRLIEALRSRGTVPYESG